MNQQFQPEQIKQLLNRSLSRLDQPTLSRLHDARMQALAHYGARSAAPAFAWAGNRRAPHAHHKSYYGAAVVLLIALLFSVTVYWQQTTEHEVSEVDIAILTDELPIEVYVD